MFQVGQKVVYRHHVCNIASIREGYFEGKDYFELHAIFEKSLKLFVSVENAVEPEMRPVISREEALELIGSISKAETIETDTATSSTAALADRHLREAYDERLKSYAPEDLLPILKSVHKRTSERLERGQHITATDKKYFDLAESLLCDELSIALDVDRERIDEYIIECVKSS